MKKQINGNTLELITGDITEQETEAIVNAANGTLLGGTGVDGAIHRAAGKELLEECKKIREQELKGEELQVGEVVMTKGYQLPATFVIHTVGPVWQEDSDQQKTLLANCYHKSLQIAAHQGLQSIPFPSISTGVYGYPIEEASQIALTTVIDYLSKNTFGEVVFTLFSEEDDQVYTNTLERLLIK